MKYCLALDVACGRSMACFLSSEGELVLPPTEYRHIETSFSEMLSPLRNLDDAEVYVIMESTSVYHLPVERYFRERTDYNVIVINPIIARDHKRNLRKTKTDQLDCLNLANIFFRGDYNLQSSHETIYTEMQMLSRQLFHLQQGQIRTKNRFHQLLALTCPEYNELFSRQFLFSRTALHFIETYPHCDMVKSESIDALEKCLGAPYRKRTYNYRKMAEKIKITLDDNFAAVPVSSLTVSCVVDTIHRLRTESAEIESIKERLIALAKHTPLYDLYLSIPGVGPITAALLVAELKDIRRFDNIKKLTASCGLDPTIVQSGKTINYHGPISKRGNRNARYVLFNTVMSLLMVTKRNAPDDPVRLYYEKKRGEGKHHHACVVACCTKLLRIMFAMSKQNKLYR